MKVIDGKYGTGRVDWGPGAVKIHYGVGLWKYI